MNLKRSSGILATGAIALALIGTGVGAALTDHYSGTQSATVDLTPVVSNPVLSVTSNSTGAVVDPLLKTVTFAPYTVTTPDSDPTMGGAYNQFSITSTGTGTLAVSATVTSNMPAAELAKFTLDNAGSIYQLSTTQIVVATTATGVPQRLDLGLMIDWAGLTQAAQGYTLTVTYSIDAS